jgi:thioredoxin reductase
MSSKSRFIIQRKDRDGALDDAFVESDGLTIGRLITNELVLNHRAVSRTHAGIIELEGTFWLFNLSESNGTLLNNELVDRMQLGDGDLIQIGPFLLLVRYLGGALWITVERELQMQAFEGSVSAPLPASASEAEMKTYLVKIRPGASRRASRAGMLTGVLSIKSEKALEIFWKKRQREAGKMAEKTRLHPRGDQKVGKAQFNWRPTLDLRRVWRSSYFVWGAAVVVMAAAAAYFLYESAYSPGQVSRPHRASFAPAALLKRNIAARENAASCSNCHAVTEGMQDKCIGCHVTQASGEAPAFRPTIYDAHDRENIACSSCHTEHQGPDKKDGLMNYSLCANCHNGSYVIRTGERAGDALPIPHGGSVGYPVENGRWQWKLTPDDLRRKRLPQSWASDSSKDQFHSIHQMGRMAGLVSCADCHEGVRGTREWIESPRNECAKCHGVAFQRPDAGAGIANCNSCHVQHGKKNSLEEFASSLSEGTDPSRLKQYLESLSRETGADQSNRKATVASFRGMGAAEVIRQDRDGLDLASVTNAGAIPWYGWVALIGLIPLAGLVSMAAGVSRRRSALKASTARAEPVKVAPVTTGSLNLERLRAEGPGYPYPVVDPMLCIGCHGCVEACPHDVLAIVNGIATPIAPDQCMEDTGCVVECPTNPKACILLNGTKPIPPRRVPERTQRLMTNVDGIYMVGDVSGVPLIKNAINEGGQVIDYVQEDLEREGPSAMAEYDVAIIGVGPAGLSAAVIASQRGLSYVAIEQDRVVSTIANYPAGKYVFFKPETVEARGGIPLPGAGEQKESIIQSWMDSMLNNGVIINEEERCKEIKREGDCFSIVTELKGKQRVVYLARKVILAIGNRGTPMKLNIEGENLKIKIQPPPSLAKHCVKCGQTRRAEQSFCVRCGIRLPVRESPPFDDDKVKYKLSDPDDYSGKKCIVVGAGNSAVEAAVDLVGFRRNGDSFDFTRDNEVTLVIRSDFKGDLKLGNKMNVYDCIDAGKIKVYFRTEIKRIEPKEVVLMDVRSKKEIARLPNDYVFALIGGERPTKFLEALGVKISGQ